MAAMASGLGCCPPAVVAARVAARRRGETTSRRVSTGATCGGSSSHRIVAAQQTRTHRVSTCVAHVLYLLQTSRFASLLCERDQNRNAKVCSIFPHDVCTTGAGKHGGDLCVSLVAPPKMEQDEREDNCRDQVYQYWRAATRTRTSSGCPGGSEGASRAGVC